VRVFFPGKKLIVGVLLLCLVLLLVFAAHREAPYIVRSHVTDIIEVPFLVVQFIVHEVRAFFYFHHSYWQNMRLRQENEALRADANQCQTLTAENQRLRELLDLREKSAWETIPASVAGRDFNTFRPFLILNRGSRHGVRKYAPVLTAGGLVGKVLEVGFFSSKVILINDPDLAVPARVMRTREQGLLSGTLDGRCKLRFLDVDSDVQEGDMVVTSGLNMTYPPDIPLGRVKVIGLESSGLGKFAVIQTAVRLSALEEVLVVVQKSDASMAKAEG
jgi:rod shape-determining protein MreC